MATREQRIAAEIEAAELTLKHCLDLKTEDALLQRIKDLNQQLKRLRSGTSLGWERRLRHLKGG